ncbi:GIN domain-containing protein [Flavobacterium chuncheonense]|uniref:GIN domain-containing protein n=1 Tax=Flavobacterium chuncheonense TaxID=2026653 RepID=A0ABW5YL06_9FLAO
MKKITLFTLLLCSIITFAQKKEKIKGSKIITVSVKELEPYENIEIEDNLEIFLVKGDSPTLEIEADDNLHDAINYSVMGNTLRITSQKEVISAKKFSIRVNYNNNLKLVSVKGEAKLHALAAIELENITIKNYDRSASYLNADCNFFTLILNDKAEAELNLKAQNTILELSKDSELKALVASPEVKLDMYQNSDARIEGDAENVKMRIDNSSFLAASKFTTKSLDLTIEGYAKSEVNVVNDITISAAGKSEIRLFGEPQIEITKFSNTTTLYKKEL